MPQVPTLPNPFSAGQVLSAQQLEDMRKTVEYTLSQSVVAGPGLLSNQVGGKIQLSAMRQRNGGSPRSFRVTAGDVEGTLKGYVSTGTVLEKSEGFVPYIWSGEKTGVVLSTGKDLEDTDDPFALIDNDVNYAYIKITTGRSQPSPPIGTGGYTYYRSATRMQIVFDVAELDWEDEGSNIFAYYLPVGHIELLAGVVVEQVSYIEQTPIFSGHPSAVELDPAEIPAFEANTGFTIYRANLSKFHVTLAQALTGRTTETQWSLEFAVTSSALDAPASSGVPVVYTNPIGTADVTDTTATPLPSGAELFNGDAANATANLVDQTYYRIPMIRDGITISQGGVYRENIRCVGSRGPIVELIRIG